MKRQSKIKLLLLRLITFIFHPTTLIFFKNFRGTIIFPSVILKGSRKICIRYSIIARRCSIKAFGREKETIVINKSYIADRAYFSSMGKHSIIIKNARIAPNCFIGGYRHKITYHEVDSHYMIMIDSPRLIGQNVSIFGNVTIGTGSVVGACTVITKDIEPFSMVVGNPAKIIKRYSKELDEWISVKN